MATIWPGLTVVSAQKQFINCHDFWLIMRWIGINKLINNHEVLIKHCINNVVSLFWLYWLSLFVCNLKFNHSFKWTSNHSIQNLNNWCIEFAISDSCHWLLFYTGLNQVVRVDYMFVVRYLTFLTFIETSFTKTLIYWAWC